MLEGWWAVRIETQQNRYSVAWANSLPQPSSKHFVLFPWNLAGIPFVYGERMGDPMNNRIYQAGQRLRQIREERGLTLRDVEEHDLTELLYQAH